MEMFRTFLPIVAVAVTAALSGGASATEAAARHIVYNEATNSYFELREDLPGAHPRWWHAEDIARRQFHRGARGRLAVIRDHETMDFVRKHFDIKQETWIGARFFCTFHKLVWVDGEVHEPTDYSNWAAKWHRTDIRCPDVTWMPIYLRPAGSNLFWQASGPNKAFHSYLVEYPAGRP